MKPFLYTLLILLSACSSTTSVSPVTEDDGVSLYERALPPGELSAMKDESARVRAHAGWKGMVVSDDEVASQWGVDILKQGGNAVDAAIATAMMLAVTRPHAGSIGGGGFLLYCPSPKNTKHKECEVIDYREQAPDASHAQMFVVDGKPKTDLSQTGALAVGVPGVVAGLSTAHEKFGKLAWSRFFSEPIRRAQQGITVTPYMQRGIEERREDFNSEAKKLFGNKKIGDIIKQPDLAQVLAAVSARGRKGFYEGWVAQKILAGLKSAGGLMTKDDLSNYAVKTRKPLQTTFNGFDIYTMPPPSAGGTLIIQMLKYMEFADQEGQLDRGYGSAKTLHAEAHAMKLAFADRAQWFGDPEFTKIPLDQLLSQSYLKERWSDTFSSGSASQVKGSGINPKDFKHTTHFSVIDAEGNAVALTTTINDNFGSGFIAPGTGVFLNDEMDDFSIQPGVANMFGLLGSEANLVQGQKRPLSSMSPTIVRDMNGENRIVVGAAGGPRITTSVFQILMNRLRFGMQITDAMHAGRIHHQWKPEKLRIEKSQISPDVAEKLQSMGYKVEMARELAHAHALERDPATGLVWGAHDPRGEGDSVSQ
ncbi:MAG: gamma-glutamyltransferase [Xanthomonadaceae bacterium]|nr:gamma-glutamyltransferase [Xanthomonadaceae bacterium]